MKKTLLLLTTALAFSASAEIGYYQYAGGTPTAVSELTAGKQYLIYDCYESRYAIRKAFDDSDVIGGDHQTPEEVNQFSSHYAWTVTKNGDSWSFQNVFKGKYIPGLSGNNGSVSLSDEAGLFTMEAYPGTTDGTTFNLYTTGTDKCSWDGNDAQGGGTSIWSMAEWGGNGHPYKFYELAELPYVVISYVKDNNTVWEEAIINGELPSLPAELGTMSAVENHAATFTIAANVSPVKIVCARNQNQWIGTNATGLFTTAQNTNYNQAEWFLQSDYENGFSLYALTAKKYAGTIGSGQVPFSDTPVSYVLEPNQNGPAGIVNTIGGNGFNLSGGSTDAVNVAGWSVGDDASSHWFLVYDYNQFNANLWAGYFVPGQNEEGGTSYLFPYNGNAKFTNNNPWYNAQQAAIDAVTAATAAGVDAADIATVQALIDAAKTTQFGAAGVVITDKIAALNDAATALQEKVAAMKDVTVNFVKDNVTYGTIVFKGQAPTYPESLGTMGALNDNDVATFTFAEGVQPFKMVSARYNEVWATTNTTGLYHSTQSEGSYEAGAYLMMVGNDESCALFVPSAGKYVDNFGINGQATYTTTPANFVIEHSQVGPISVKGANGVYMNDINGLNAGNIGGWYRTNGDNPDAGSYWFIVYDNETYEANMSYYWNTTEGDVRTEFSDGVLSDNNAWYVAQQNAKDAITEATEGNVPEKDIASVQALVDEAFNVNFGKTGVNIAQMIDNLNSATENLNKITSGISEVSVAEGVAGAVYDLQGRRVANATRGLYIINGKKVLVK